MRAKLLCAVIVIAAAIGCTEKTPHNAADPELLSKILLKTAPKPRFPLGIRFENKVRLIGYDFPDTVVEPNRPFKITWYWAVDAPLGGHFKVFTHLADGKKNRVNLDSNRALRRVYPEAQWKAGDFLKDEQEITLPGDWNSNIAVFYLGFYDGDVRMDVTQGEHDSERRAEALRLRVGPVSAPTPVASVPRLVARRVSGPIKVDGKLDEPDWHAAQSTGPFLNTMNGNAAPFQARAQVLYDNEKLYCSFVVSDDYLKTTFEHTDDHLWEQDTVEVMLDPDGDAQNYFELQVSPRGVHFDTRYDSPRQPRPFGHVDWDSHVEAKVHLNGTLNDDKADEGYVVEMAIPWTSFATGATPAPPPAAGATWRMNFFVMDARKDGQRAAGWSPPLIGDFHTLAKFGRVVFLEGVTPTAATH